MSRDLQTDWTIRIAEFIDELDERHLLGYFRDARLAMCYQTHLLTAKMSDNVQDKKERMTFDKRIKKIRGIEVSFSIKDGEYRKKLKDFQEKYQEFLQLEKKYPHLNTSKENKNLKKLEEDYKNHYLTDNYSSKKELIGFYKNQLLSVNGKNENYFTKDELKAIKKNIATLVKKDSEFDSFMRNVKSLYQKALSDNLIDGSQSNIERINKLEDRIQELHLLKKNLIQSYQDKLLSILIKLLKAIKLPEVDEEKFKKESERLEKIKKEIEKTHIDDILKKDNTYDFSIAKLDLILDELKECYQDFVQKGYVANIDEQIKSIAEEDNFYKLWIYQLLAEADGVTLGTHIAKLTHSSSEASSLVDEIDEAKAGFLTTSTLKKLVYDGTYASGAAMSKYAKFYLLNIDNKPLGLLLKQGDSFPLSGLFSDKEELKQVIGGFVKLLNPSLQADSLAKQVYFPLDIHDKSYHQLVILQSSSLAQEIHQRFFGEARKQRDKIDKIKESGKYHTEIIQYPPKTLFLSTVASQPQNVSVLLGSRGSGARLFDGSAPIWQRQTNPPIHQKSFFDDDLLNARARDSITGLQSLLMTFDGAGISFKEPARLKGVLNWLNAVIDDVLDYAGEIANIETGWSNTPDCKLPLAHQVLLDYEREDSAFLVAKDSHWQAVLVDDFVLWLNRRLHKENQFSVNDEHGRVWRDEFADRLREYVELLDVSLIQQGAKA